MLRSRLIPCLVPVLLASCVLAVGAQVGSATVVLTVVLPDGADADSTLLEWTSTHNTGATRSMTIHESASTAVLDLPPGSYRVQVRRVGFRPGTVEVSLTPGTAVYLTGRLAPVGGAAESLIVTTHRFDASYQMSFGRDDLQNLPGSRTVWSLLETVHPFLISDRIDNGGLWSAEPALIGGYGSSWTQTTFRLGGFNITEPQELGTPLFYPDLNVLQAVEVDAAVMPAESRGPGPVISLIPRAPGMTWAGTAQASFTPKSLQSEVSGDIPSLARFNSWTDGSVSGSGPLVGRRLSVFASARATRVRRFDRVETAQLRGDVRSLYAHILAAPVAGEEVRVTTTLSDMTRPYAGRARFEDRQLEERARVASLQGSWERIGAAGAWSLGASYQRLTATPEVGAQAIGGTIERLRDGPPLALAMPADGLRQRWDMNISVTPPVRQWLERDNVLQLGATFSLANATARPVAQPAFRELVNGQPARVWDVGYVGPESMWSAMSASAFVSDRVSVTPRFALDAGVRLDYETGSADGASSDIRWVNVSPRLSVRWRLTDSGSITLVGGYGRYPHNLPLSYFAVGDPAGPAGTVYRWDDVNGDRRHDGSELTLLGPVGFCCAGGAANTIDPELRRPTTDEFLIGIERAAGPWRLRFTGLDRRERNLVALVNVGVTATQDYTVMFIQDPGVDIAGRSGFEELPIYNRRVASFGRDRYTLTNVGGKPSRHQGLEIAIERNLSGSWSMRFGAAAYRSEGVGASRGFLPLENDQGLLGEASLTPNAQTSARGRLFFDRAYVIKLSGTYLAPGDVHLGLVARYQDGQPFSRVIIAEGLNQGPEIVQAYPRGGQRFTFTFTLDARVEKEVVLGRGRLGIVLETFNLLNTLKEVEEDVVTGPSFRTMTALQPPRAIRFGLRLAF